MPCRNRANVKPKTHAEQFAQSIVARAEKGDVRAAAEIADRTEGKATQRIDMQESIETRERERQVRFLVHTIKTTQQQIGGDVSVERIWAVVEERESTVFGESVGHLRPAVFAALGVGDEKAD